MKRKTKIVCTIGPAVNTREGIESLIEAGMNVARLNFSHGTYDEFAQMIALLKDTRRRLQVPLAIMLDTKGPEVRLGKIQGGQIEVQGGNTLTLTSETILGNQEKISLYPPVVFDHLQKGMTLLIDDGYIIAHVEEVNSKDVRIRIDYGGVIKSKKSVSIQGAIFDFPALTEQDKLDIKFGCEQEIDIVAASFVRSAEHVMQIKKLLEDLKRPDIAVIAKIENREGVQNIDSIVQMADGIMIARGDLGVELPLAQVPRLQKMMIRKCYLAGKPSVTATQMLESMINNPRPTRAETSDVANAIYDSTSVAMLSGETAIGKFPIEAVKFMNAIIEETEASFNYYDFFKHTDLHAFHDVPSSVSLASIRTAYSAHAKAIFAFTTSGSTARLLSRFRPEMPIIAMTPHPRVYHQLALSWGVIPILCTESHTIEEAYRRITQFALEKGYVKYGDLVVITAGTPFGRAGTTNMIIVDSIGDVLVRGKKGYGKVVSGKIAIVTSHESIKEYEVKGKIVVLSQCDESYLPLLRSANGVLLENHIDDLDSEYYLKQVAKELGISALLRAEGATHILRPEQLVTLDPEQAILYKGII